MTSKTDASWTSISKIVALTLCLIAAGLIFCGHAVHVLGVLPYLFLLACPLMHLFMHHGHGHEKEPRNASLPIETKGGPGPA